MASTTEKKLRKLFDYQRFEKDEKLQGVIDGIINDSSSRRLSDDELEFAAGGKEIPSEEDTEPQGFCPKCNKMMPVKIFTGGRYVCKKCGTRIDETTIKHFGVIN